MRSAGYAFKKEQHGGGFSAPKRKDIGVFSPSRTTSQSPDTSELPQPFHEHITSYNVNRTCAGYLYSTPRPESYARPNQKYDACPNSLIYLERAGLAGSQESHKLKAGNATAVKRLVLTRSGLFCGNHGMSSKAPCRSMPRS